MAITRCPYCHAIIDENDKYCNNCGTQLLFPEDDEVDEEIPGEKIVDAEVEEKDYTVEEPEDEKRPAAAKDLDEDLDEELEEELKEEAAETALDEIVAEEALEEAAADITEEVILVDDIEAAGAADKASTGELGPKAGPSKNGEAAGEGEETEDAEKNEDDEDEEEDTAEIDEEDVAKKEETGGALATEVEAKDAEGETVEYVKPGKTPAAAGDEEAAIEYITEPAAEADDLAAATAGESDFRAVTFDTKDFDAIGKTVELSKDKIDEFIEGLVDKKPAGSPAPAALPSETAAPDEPPAEGPAPARESLREPTGSLPPWASTMKGAPVFPPDSAVVEPKKGRAAEPPAPSDEEVEIFPRRKASDSSIGLPERVSQAPLPFARDATEEEAAGEEEREDETLKAAVPLAEPVRPDRPPVPPVREPWRREAEAAAELEEAEPRPPFSFSVFLKSKVFDVLFVGIFWLAALWLAANATGQTFFEILGSVSGPMLLLYAVFVFLYFFLFKFFLGETLGDRLFRPRE